MPGRAGRPRLQGRLATRQEPARRPPAGAPLQRPLRHRDRRFGARLADAQRPRARADYGALKNENAGRKALRYSALRGQRARAPGSISHRAFPWTFHGFRTILEVQPRSGESACPMAVIGAREVLRIVAVNSEPVLRTGRMAIKPIVLETEGRRGEKVKLVVLETSTQAFRGIRVITARP